MIKSIRLLAVIAVTTVAPVVFSGCTAKARKARHLAHARQDVAHGDLDSAEVEYMNVLKLDGLNPDAIAGLATMFYDQGRMGRVVPLLLKARELRPDDLAVRIRLAKWELSVGRFDDARADADYVLRRDPRNEDAPVLLASAAAKPADIPATQARIEQIAGSLGPTAPIKLARAILAFRQGRPSEGKLLLDEALMIAPQYAAANSALGTYYQAKNDRSSAEAAFAAAAKYAPPRSPLPLQYAALKRQSGDNQAAKAVLAAIAKQTPDYLPAWLALAELSAAENKYPDALADVERVLDRDALNPDALVLRARLQIAMNDPAKAITDLEKAIAAYPQAPVFPYYLGLAYLARNDTDRAVTNFKRAITMAPNYLEAVVALADVNVRMGDFTAVIAPMKTLIGVHPDLMQARLILADAYRGLANWDEAVAVYRHLIEQFPQSADPYVMLGSVLLQEGQTAEAAKAFTKALDLAPDHFGALQQLVSIDLAAKHYQVALQRIEPVIARNPKQAQPLVLESSVFVAQGNTSRAEAVLLHAIAVQPNATQAYFLLARLYYRAGQVDKAIARLQEIAAKNPKDTASLIILGTLYETQKNYAAARATYEKVLVTDPKSGPALNNLAYLYSEQFGEIDKAYELAQRSRELSPHEPHIADTLGWIVYRRHQYTRALGLIEESVRALPNSALAQYHLGRINYMLGREAAAKTAFDFALRLEPSFDGAADCRSCLATLAIDPARADASVVAQLKKTASVRPDDVVALSRLAASYEHSGAIKQAIETDEDIRRLSPDNVQNLLNLVRLYERNSDQTQAFEIAKLARKSAPDDSNVAHVLGRLACRSGDYAWAVSLLEEARQMQSEDPDLLLDLAQATFALGHASDALSYASRAIQSGSKFSRLAEAQRFARLADLSQDPARAAAARSEIDADVAAAPSDVMTLWTHAVAVEHDSASAARAEYEKLLARAPAFNPAKRALALLDAASPTDANRAYDLLLASREAYPTDSRVAKALGVVLYHRREYSRAITFLNEAANAPTADAETFYYLGMARHQSKDRSGARQALERALAANLEPTLAIDAKRVLAAKN